MITVLGATGKTGRVVAERLLDAEEMVRVVGRDPGRLEPLTRRGAVAAVGDLHDARFLMRALSGSDAAYILLPTDLTVPDVLADFDRKASSIVAAVSESGIWHVVLLSSVGAEHPEGTGLVGALHRLEEQLREITTLSALFLRAGYFYENHFGSLGTIKRHGINGGVIASDVPVPTVTTAHVGAMAARALRARDFTGIALAAALGPRDLTMRETTRIVGQAIGRPDLPYVELPPEVMVQGLTEAGCSQDGARRLVEMGQALGARRMQPPEPRNERNTGTTTFEDFVPALAAAYRAS